MSRFLKREYTSLEEYTPGEQPQGRKYVKLNTNESPYPPSEKALAAAQEELARSNLYPDPDCALLKEAIAEHLGLKRENIFIGNGSDEVLSFSFMAFFSHLPVIFPDISYGFYKVYAELYGCQATFAPLKDDFSIDINDYIGKNSHIVIANPNAPTGILLSVSDIEKIIASNHDKIVLIDEAYIDFGGESAVTLVNKYDNLIVARTFSKSRSLAGARLGFAAANEAIIRDLEKIKFSTNPYNINRTTLAIGLGAINDTAYFEECRKKIIENRDYTSNELKKLGFTMTDSRANFIFARHNAVSGEELYLALKEKGVLVRHFDSPRTKDYNRITIGTREETDILISKISEILEEKK